MNRKWIYGFNVMHRVTAWRYVNPGWDSVAGIKNIVEWMVNTKPDVFRVYMVDDRIGLSRDFNDAFKSKDFTEHFAFEDMIARDGIILYGGLAKG